MHQKSEGCRIGPSAAAHSQGAFGHSYSMKSISDGLTLKLHRRVNPSLMCEYITKKMTPKRWRRSESSSITKRDQMNQQPTGWCVSVWLRSKLTGPLAAPVSQQPHSHPDGILDKWSQNVCSVLIKKCLHFLSLLMKILVIAD